MSKNLKTILGKVPAHIKDAGSIPDVYADNLDLTLKIDNQVKSALIKSEIQERAKAEAENISDFAASEIKKCLSKLQVYLAFDTKYNKLYVVPNTFDVVTNGNKEPDGTAFLKLENHFSTIDIRSEYDPDYDKVVKYPSRNKGGV